MMARLDGAVACPKDRREAGARSDVDRVLGEHPHRLAMALVSYVLREMLDEVTAAQDVEQLEAAADRERREVSLERRLEEPELARVAPLLCRVSRGVPLGAIPRWIDVDAAGEHDPVEDVERLVDPVLARGNDESTAARLLDRVDVVERHERGGQLPCPPSRRLRVRRDPDDRPTVAHHAMDAS